MVVASRYVLLHKHKAGPMSWRLLVVVSLWCLYNGQISLFLKKRAICDYFSLKTSMYYAAAIHAYTEVCGMTISPRWSRRHSLTYFRSVVKAAEFSLTPPLTTSLDLLRLSDWTDWVWNCGCQYPEKKKAAYLLPVCSMASRTRWKERGKDAPASWAFHFKDLTLKYSVCIS